MALLPAELYASLVRRPLHGVRLALLRLSPCLRRSPASVSPASRFSATVGGRAIRLAGLLVVGRQRRAYFLAYPGMLGGPYGLLSPEVKAVLLDTVSEAQPIWGYAEREPVGAFGSLVPLSSLALVVALRRCGRAREAWIVPTVLLALAVALSFYQMRTLPFASAHRDPDPRRVACRVLVPAQSRARTTASARASGRARLPRRRSPSPGSGRLGRGEALDMRERRAHRAGRRSRSPTGSGRRA